LFSDTPAGGCPQLGGYPPAGIFFSWPTVGNHRLFPYLGRIIELLPTPCEREQPMELGAFSISLAVKNLQASRDFYAHFGFEQIGGDADQHWLILRNGSTTIGLFEGMFEQNILTFNPGWDAQNQPLETFTDAREIHRILKDRGVELMQEVGLEGSGPASFVAVDPDGNPVLVDQHV